MLTNTHSDPVPDRQRFVDAGGLGSGWLLFPLH
jgi:hypothetical protein